MSQSPAPRFLPDLYDSLHDSPAQRRFRRIAPMPIGCVFIQSPDMTEQDVRRHLRLMKELGFNALKQILVCPGTSTQQIMHWALDEGIIPWWYGQGGWDEINDELLMRLGIPLDTPIERVRTHPKMLAHQQAFLRQRIDRMTVPIRPAGDVEGYDPAANADGPRLDPGMYPAFVRWLQGRYASVAELVEAWNLRHADIFFYEDRAAPRLDELWRTWDDVALALPKHLGGRGREYRRMLDVMRFKADLYLDLIRRTLARRREADPLEPQRAGGEMGLFLPFAWRCTDMEGIAQTLRDYGSFYPSLHLAWHFEESDFEYARQVYMHSSLSVDWFKGGWSATWESTGGPQQLSGGKAWDLFKAQQVAGFTVNEGTITQLMLSYLAGGYRGVGMWCWNPRTAGWETGEYALLDRNSNPSPRAIRAGQIGKAMNRYRDELWRARKEPIVGVFWDWDQEAIWAAVSVMGRDMYRHFPVWARAGACRALIDHNIPFEHVTKSDLLSGLADRYRVIYLPAVIAFDPSLWPILRGFVERGGRLVLDLPGAWMDTFGRLLPTGPGSDFERVFGVALCDFQYASDRTPRRVRSVHIDGFVADLTPTAARVLAAFDSGAPAVTEHRLGDGAAVVLGLQASLTCFKPGHADLEALIVRHTLGDIDPPYTCEGAAVYRLWAPEADHYFFINDGPARTVRLHTPAYRYAAAEDAVFGQTIDLARPIALDAYSGRWLRCRHA